MLRLDGKTVVVVGLGRSGVAAAKMCVSVGASRVIATDAASAERLAQRIAPLERLPVELILGGHEGVPWEKADLVVVSPGVPLLREVALLEQHGVEVCGELDLATRAVEAQVAVVGGTNGKSTVTSLVGEMLAAQPGLKSFVGGNLGTPLAERAGERFDWVLLEVSSFQAEHVPTLHPRVAALLNISDDHLDRYPNAQAYADAKGNVFVRQDKDDVAVIPWGDEACARQASRGKAAQWTFGEQGTVHKEGDEMVTAWGSRFPFSWLKLSGLHNQANAMAAVAVAHAMGLSDEAIGKGLRRFRGLPHRAQFVTELRGVRFYDDSKGTNVGAAVTALLGLREDKAVLIAGGRDKGGSYEPLVRALRRRGRAVVTIGEAAERIEQAIGAAVPVTRAETMDEAVERAMVLAEPGDAVLLSPACSSFDMFPNYGVRGDVFQQAVMRLARATTHQEEPER